MLEDKSELFLQFIKNVTESGTFNKALVDKNLTIAHSLYDDGWRHSYSVVTQYYLEQVETAKLNLFLEQAVTNLSSLLAKIIDDSANIEDLETKRCRRSIEKLKDHINLEVVRLAYTGKIKEDALSTSRKALDNSLKATENIDKVNKAFQNMRKESVTVLGIFASIVVAFVGGSTLTASIFSNMHKVDTPLLCFLTVLIIGFISNLVFQLFNFLRRINDLDGPNTSLKWYNIALSVVSVACLVWQYVDSAFW